MTIQEQVLALFMERERQSKKTHNGIQVTIGGKDATKNIPLPAKWNSMLDERLDEGRLSIRHAKTPLFQPLTPVEISLTSKKGVTTTRSFLVSADESTETPAGSGYHNHELSLIEQTKELEGIIVDALTYTNDLGRNYTDNPTKAEPIYE